MWFWQSGRIEIHLLHGERYEPASRSALFPELDLDLLVSFLDPPTLTQAMRAYREALGR